MKRKKIYYCAVITLLVLISSVSISAAPEAPFTKEELQTAIDDWADDNCLTSERLACHYVISYDGNVIGSGVARGYHH